MIQPQFSCLFFLSRLTLIEANTLMEYFMQLTSIENEKKLLDNYWNMTSHFEIQLK